MRACAVVKDMIRLTFLNARNNPGTCETVQPVADETLLMDRTRHLKHHCISSSAISFPLREECIPHFQSVLKLSIIRHSIVCNLFCSTRAAFASNVWQVLCTWRTRAASLRRAKRKTAHFQTYKLSCTRWTTCQTG